MGDLDPSVLKQFHNSFGGDDITSRESKKHSARLTETSGIAGLIPGSSLDSFLFSPCGYSMNGLKGDKYWTIHVTPQPSCNFASFETGRYIFHHHQYRKEQNKQCPKVAKMFFIIDDASVTIHSCFTLLLYKGTSPLLST